MSMNDKQAHSTPDDDLLARAIPIDSLEKDGEGDELEPVDLAPSSVDESQRPSKIRSFDAQQTSASHAEHWNRKPNATGQGAIHVRTFVSKLRLDAIEHLDGQINEWLDEHPEYEVKFVTTSIGQLVAKNTEDALFVSVWV